MYPVIATVGPLSISSFGLFMALGFLAGVFTVWRVARSYDINEEKILDLTLFTFLGGLVGARLYFVALNPGFIAHALQNVILLNKYPGLSFWGGLLGGFLTLYLCLRRTKLNFWLTADLAAAGLLIGLAIGDVGCFLGGCSYGVVSNLPIASPVVGLIGKRFPVALVEAVILALVFLFFKAQVLRFHFAGKVAANFLIVVGAVKFLLGFLRGDSRIIFAWVSDGHLLSVLAVILGTVIFYTRSKRSITKDLGSFISVPFSPKKRKEALSSVAKSWYNIRIDAGIKLRSWSLSLASFPSKLKRKFNVKSTPKELR